MKTYNPRERYCAMCGKLIITRNPSEYVYRRRDYRVDSSTRGKTLLFCGNTCLRKWDAEYPSKSKRRYDDEY